MLPPVPAAWKDALAEELARPSFADLQRFLEEERRRETVFPAEGDVFSALDLTPLDDVRVLILGQDPYPGAGQAHGLSFSVRPGIAIPASLGNIFKELEDDVGATPPGHGHLEAWAKQGVLLLNAVLTVRAHAPNSHKGKGWEPFTDGIIRAVSAQPAPVGLRALGGVRSEEEGARRHQPARGCRRGASLAVGGAAGILRQPAVFEDQLGAACGRPTSDRLAGA